MRNFSVLSWNIQGEWNFTGHTFFKKIEGYLQQTSADVIALQELCNAKLLLQRAGILEKYYSFIPPSPTGKNVNHNIILSKYPIVGMAEVVFPANDKKKKPDNCTRADIEIAGSVVRVYNCQFPIFRVGPSERKRLLHYILQDAAKHQGPTIICGDLNTTIPAPGFKRTIIQNWHMEPNAELEIAGTFMHRDERFLVHDTITKHGFVEALDLHIPTWSGLKTKLWELFHLKLDWFMVKNLTVVSTALGDYVSDHKAIEVRCAFTDTK